MGRAAAKMPRVVKVITLGLLVGAVALAGCTASPSGGGSPAAAAAARQGPPPYPGPAVTVSLHSLTFSPATVTAHVGQRVHWVNNDNLIHNVIAEDGSTFQSPNFGPGGSYTYTATVAGTYQYTCSIHPDMMATLVVVK